MNRWFPRWACVPILWYLAGTLLVPLLNGASGHPGFWTHAAVVLAAAGTLLLVACGAQAVRTRAANRARLRAR